MRAVKTGTSWTPEKLQGVRRRKVLLEFVMSVTKLRRGTKLLTARSCQLTPLQNLRVNETVSHTIFPATPSGACGQQAEVAGFSEIDTASMFALISSGSVLENAHEARRRVSLLRYVINVTRILYHYILEAPICSPTQWGYP